MNFADLKAKVLKLLGLSAFPVKDGKHEFTEEQTAKLESIEKGFAQKLTQALDKELEKSGEEENIMTELRENVSVLSQEKEELTRQNQQQLEQIEQLSRKPEDDVTTETPPNIIGLSKHERKLDMSKQINQVALKASKGDLEAINAFMSKVSASEIDISEIIADANFDTFYNQEKREIARTLTFGFTSEKLFTRERAVEMYRATKGSFTEVVQPFVAKWTPKGQGKFTPITILNRRHKINVEFKPADIEAYLFYLYDESLSPAEMPIAKYLYEKQIRPQILNDIEMKMIGTGKYVEPSADIKENDAGLPASQSLDGVCTILDNLYAGSNNVNWIDDDIWTIDNAEDQARKYYKKIVNTPYRTLPLNLIVSPENKDTFRECVKQKYRNGIADTNVPMKIDGTNITVTAADFLIGQEHKFMTPKQNLKLLRHKNNPDRIRMADDKKYDVFVIGEFWLAPGFAIEEEIWASVPDFSASGSGSAS